MKILSDTGDYLIVECPHCGSDSYIYKNNPYKIFCNSKNSCGKDTTLTKQDRRELELDDANDDSVKKISISKESRLFLSKFVKNTAKAFPFPESIRGLSVETLRAYSITYLEGGIHDFLLKYSDNFNEFSTKTSFNRDVLIPILGEDGEIDRILLRQLTPKPNEQKEIQFKVNQYAENVNEIWNIHEILNSTKKYVFVTEGVYDGLSGYEVNNNLIPVSLPGVGKWKQIIKFITDHGVDNFKEKTFLLAFDNDVAGQKYLAEIQKAMENLHLLCEIIDFSPFKYIDNIDGKDVELEIKDANKMLEKDRKELENLLSKYK